MDELKLYNRALSEDEITAKEAPEIAFEDICLDNILTQDIYKTQYHGGPYQHWMNEPHAPLYYNGMYHLFYQNNIVGTYWRNICWGHLVSEDMVNWKPVKEAITPTEDSVVPDGVWSGGAALDVNGIPVLFFTAGNDSFAKDGLISNQNIGAAYPADLSDPELTDWVICDELAVRQEDGQGRAGEFRDPHIWKEGDAWCMLICSGSVQTNGGSAILYETKTLEVKEDGTIDMDWQYMGPVYEMKDQPVTYGTSWELPILLPVSNEAGTVTRYAFSFHLRQRVRRTIKFFILSGTLMLIQENLRRINSMIINRRCLIMAAMYLRDQVRLLIRKAGKSVCSALCRTRETERKKAGQAGHTV